MRFDEAKVTQAAARILKLRGGQMHFLKLIKLLYLLDREALRRWGVPVTWDHYVSMDHGPVLSRVYDLIRDEIPKPIWSQYISAPLGDYEVKLLNEAIGNDRLSRAEERLIDEVFGQYGDWNRWRLVDLMHTFPEWQNPQGSSLPISLRVILKAVGVDDDDIQAILREHQAATTAEEILSAALT